MVTVLLQFIYRLTTEVYTIMCIWHEHETTVVSIHTTLLFIRIKRKDSLRTNVQNNCHDCKMAVF